MEKTVTVLGAVTALSYFFLFHIGFISFFIFLLASLYRKDFSINLSPVKLLASGYGAGVGMLMYFCNVYYQYPNQDAPLVFIFTNLPALFTVMYIPTSQLDPNSYHWEVFVIYGVYGLIGGWGLGQFVQWLFSDTRRVYECKPHPEESTIRRKTFWFALIVFCYSAAINLYVLLYVLKTEETVNLKFLALGAFLLAFFLSRRLASLLWSIIFGLVFIAWLVEGVYVISNPHLWWLPTLLPTIYALKVLLRNTKKTEGALSRLRN